MKTCFQTIFEINSHSKTQASEVMRTKRSKDARLVEKFGKQKDILAAEAPLQQPICSNTTDDDKTLYIVGDDDLDDLKVRHLIYIKLFSQLVARKVTYSAFLQSHDYPGYQLFTA